MEGKEVELIGRNKADPLKWNVLIGSNLTKTVKTERCFEAVYQVRSLNVNRTNDEKKTALMAALDGSEEFETRALIARELMRHGADPNLQDERGLTAAHYAVLHGNQIAIEVTDKWF